MIKDCSWWRLKIYEVGVSRLIMLTAEDSWSRWFLKGDNLWMCVDRLSNIYEACHMSLFDWMLYWIEALLRLPCISHIYNTPLSPHFYNFQLKHIVRAPSSTLSDNDPFNCCTRHWYNHRPSLIHRLGEYFLFISPVIIHFIFLDLFYTPVITSRTVSLRFCRHV